MVNSENQGFRVEGLVSFLAFLHTRWRSAGEQGEGGGGGRARTRARAPRIVPEIVPRIVPTFSCKHHVNLHVKRNCAKNCAGNCAKNCHYSLSWIDGGPHESVCELVSSFKSEVIRCFCSGL